MAKGDVRRAERAERVRRCERQAQNYPYHIQRFNDGHQWRVEHDGEAWDFWPATGKAVKTREHAVRFVAADFVDFLDRIEQSGVTA